MIRFENVGLRYGMGPEVLRDINFHLLPDCPGTIEGEVVVAHDEITAEEERQFCRFYNV